MCSPSQRIRHNEENRQRHINNESNYCHVVEFNNLKKKINIMHKNTVSEKKISKHVTEHHDTTCYSTS